MVSFYNLLRVLLLLYLGIFTYILYQLLFYHQKRFILVKTILFFSCLAVITIWAANKYHIVLFHIYLLFYFVGIYLGRVFFSAQLKQYNYQFKQFITPIKLKLFQFFKWITIPPIVYKIKEKRKLKKFYKLHPNLKPKTIYELF